MIYIKVELLEKGWGYLDHCSSALVRGTYWIVSQPLTYHDSEKYLFFDLAIHALVDFIEVPNVNI